MKKGDKNLLKVGFARANITPTESLQMEGYIYRKESADGTHDPLHAKAVAFRCGGTATVLLSLDLLFVSHEWGTEVREAIAQKTGVPLEDILVAATHTHSGPAVLSPFSTVTEATDRYEQSLFNTCVRVAKEALDSTEPATMKWCSLWSEQVVLNRRDPSGLSDNALSVIRFEDDATGRVKGHLVSFACHPTVMGPENLKYSADLFGVAARVVEDKFEGSTCVMFNGAAADASTRFTRRRQTWGELERLGKKLARQIVQASRLAAPATPGAVKAKASTVTVPFRETASLEEAERQFAELKEKLQTEFRQLLQKGIDPIDTLRPLADGISAQLAISRYGGWEAVFGATAAEIELQVIRVGDLVICGLPGEFFGETGIDLKNAALPKFAFIVGYANGYWGYIVPPKEAQKGGYEPLMSPIDPSYEPKIVREVKALVKEMKKGPSR